MQGSCIVENKHSECFDVLTPEEKILLDENTINITYKRGEIITKQGSFASHVIYLNEGLVKVYMGDDNKDLILKIIPSSHFIGLSSLFEGNNTFIYSASTYIKSTVSLIDINFFKRLIRRNSEFAYKILNIQNENVAQVYGRFYCLTRKQSCGLVADLLICLSSRVFKSSEFFLPLSRADLADLTGLSTESVMRILREFKEDKLLEAKGKIIKILDTDKLEKISKYG